MPLEDAPKAVRKELDFSWFEIWRKENRKQFCRYREKKEGNRPSNPEPASRPCRADALQT